MKLEELPTIPLRAEIVHTDAKEVRGLDLLGLRSPAEGVANRLLDGITTITPMTRYFSLRCWVILKYLRLRGLNDSKAFRAYAAKVEAAVAFGSALAGDTTTGVVGRDGASSGIQNSTGPIALSPLTKILAVSVYGGPSQDLGLGDLEGKIPGLTKERGLPLAEQFDALLPMDSVLREITVGEGTQVVERERLRELGLFLSMARPSGPEREHLVNAVMPHFPRQQELPRIASYCLLLHACKARMHLVDEADVFEIVSRQDLDGVPEELHVACDGWTQFLNRDLLVMLHEAAVGQVLDHLARSSNRGYRIPMREAVGALIADDLDATFSGLGIDGVHADLPISALGEALDRLLGSSKEVRGLRRWDGLREVTLLENMHWLEASAGLSLLPIGWILTCKRLEPGVVAQKRGFDLEGMIGNSRMGIGSVLLPEVKRWRSSSDSIRDVIGWMINRSVDQHLRIAWSRFARDSKKDVSLLQSDGDEWIFLKPMRPGRATSRLYQALNWLEQLELVDGNGITTEGEAALHRGLNSLRESGGELI